MRSSILIVGVIASTALASPLAALKHAFRRNTVINDVYHYATVIVTVTPTPVEYAPLEEHGYTRRRQTNTRQGSPMRAAYLDVQPTSESVAVLASYVEPPTTVKFDNLVPDISNVETSGEVFTIATAPSAPITTTSTRSELKGEGVLTSEPASSTQITSETASSTPITSETATSTSVTSETAASTPIATSSTLSELTGEGVLTSEPASSTQITSETASSTPIASETATSTSITSETASSTSIISETASITPITSETASITPIISETSSTTPISSSLALAGTQDEEASSTINVMETTTITPEDALPTTFVPDLDPTSAIYKGLVLQHHNIHRRNHSAEDLTWNDTMAEYAEITAKTCIWGHSLAPGGGGYGQNIAAGDFSGNITAILTNLFYNQELPLYPQFGTDTPDTTLFSQWGHFTQMVWQSTESVGCYTATCSPPGENAIDCKPDGTSYLSGLRCGNGGIRAIFTVCNYYPPGNFVGRYTNVGEPLNFPTVFVDGNGVQGL